MKPKIKVTVLTTALILSVLCGNYIGYNKPVLAANTEKVLLKGDANLDNIVNIRDASYIARTLAKRKASDLPKSADYNADGKQNIRDAASIARALAGRVNVKTQINFNFADKSEGVELRLGNENYYNGLSQQDLNYRMQKNDTTLDEYKEFSKAQILDFTDKQKQLLTEAVTDIQKTMNDNEYQLPINDEIIFINTTSADECKASGYTQENQIYLSNEIVSENHSQLLRRIICHELFHCITRSDPIFRQYMYNLIDFSISNEEPDFPQDVRNLLISNPDVERNDSYAPFTINGEKRECYMVWYLKKPYEKEGDSFFIYGETGLIPVDDLSTIYAKDDASDFWEVVGQNTDYVTAAEECLADNFSFALLSGLNGRKYDSPEIIKNMIIYMKSLH